MAEWPANGATDWNTKMLAYLAVEHQTNGTHSIKWPIDGTDTRIFTKYLTGTLDSDNQTDVVHGITGIANILHVSASLFDDVGTVYRISDNQLAATVAAGFKISYNDTSVFLSEVGANLQGNNFRIKIDYIL